MQTALSYCGVVTGSVCVDNMNFMFQMLGTAPLLVLVFRILCYYNGNNGGTGSSVVIATDYGLDRSGSNPS